MSHSGPFLRFLEADSHWGLLSSEHLPSASTGKPWPPRDSWPLWGNPKSHLPLCHRIPFVSEPFLESLMSNALTISTLKVLMSSGPNLQILFRKSNFEILTSRDSVPSKRFVPTFQMELTVYLKVYNYGVCISTFSSFSCSTSRLDGYTPWG